MTLPAPEPAVGPPDAAPFPSDRGGGRRPLLSWWPAATGLALGLASIAADDRGSIDGALLILLYATCGYAVIAFVRRPSWSWPLLGLLIVLHLAGELVSVTGPSTLITVVLATVALGTILGRWRPPPAEMRWQAWSALAFVAAALTALVLERTAAQLVVAVALLAHVAWDVVHWRRRVVVARSLSEWCAALDLTLGVGVLVLVVIT